MWYMGKAFDVKKNKAYKTMEGGLKAAKSLNLNLYDEEGKIVHQVMAEMEQEQPEIVEADISAREVENEQEGAENYAARESESDAPAIETTDDMHGSVKACDIERNSAGEAADVMTGQWDEFDGVQALRINGKIRRVFNGKLRIRNRPSWQPSAVRGISNFKEKEVTHLLEVDGKKMYRTMEGYFISADEKHVEYVGNSIA